MRGADADYYAREVGRAAATFCDHIRAVICVIVEISVAPDDVGRLADDVEKVYAGIFQALPGFLFGSLAVRRDDHRAVGVWYFDSAEALRAAGSVIEGIRAAVGISPGVTFTTVDYEVIVRRSGPEGGKLLATVEGTATPGAAP